MLWSSKSIKKIVLHGVVGFISLCSLVVPVQTQAISLDDIGKGIGDFIGGAGKIIGDAGSVIGEKVSELSKFSIPGTNINLDLTKGLDGLKDIANQIPDEVSIPGTSISVYPKLSVGENVMRNIAPFLGDAVNILDPFKPAASIARTILQFAKPGFDQWIKPMLPTFLKQGAHDFKQKISDFLGMIDVPIIKDIIHPIWDFVVGPIDDLAYDVIKLLAEESRTMTTQAGREETPSEKMILSSPVLNQKPVGIFAGIDADGVISGWAADQDTPGEAIKVHFSLDNSTTLLGLPILANDTSFDSLYGSTHGFRYAIPRKFYDGKMHTVEAWAEDSSGVWDQNIILPGSPKTFTLFNNAAGSFDSVSAKGEIRGWSVTPSIGSPAEVELYIDGWPGAGAEAVWHGTALATVKANDRRLDVPFELIRKAGGASHDIGFSHQLDMNRWTDGKHHPIYAVVKEKHPDTGQIRNVLLPGSPQYIFFPIHLPIQFKEQPIAVAQGSWVLQTVSGIPNVDHYTEILLDDVVVDANEFVRHQYAGQLLGKSIHIYKEKGQYLAPKIIDVRFKVPFVTPIGEHKVTVRHTYSQLGFVYEGTFIVQVIPPIQIKARTNDLVAGQQAEIILRSIPTLATLVGKSANTVVKEVLVASNGGQTNTPRGFESKIISIKETAVRVGPANTVIVDVMIPKEASQLVSDKAPVRLYVVLEAKDDISRGEFVITYPYTIRVPALTNEGNDPLLQGVCVSSLQPHVQFTDLTLSGGGFGCSQELTVTISGESLGKPFTIPVVRSSGVGEAGKSLARLWESVTQWDGSIAPFAEIYFGPEWTEKYGDVEKILITLTDKDDHSASATVQLDAELKVIPPKNGKIIPGAIVSVEWRGLRPNLRVDLQVDGASIHKTYLDEVKSWKKLDYLVYYRGTIPDVRLPEDLVPGTHILTMNGLRAPFVVEKESQPSEEIKPKTVEKILEAQPGKEKPTVLPKISVSPVQVQAGNSINISLAQFNPSVPITITIVKGSYTKKISGYADYTDASGKFTKSIYLDETLSAGTYSIKVNDAKGLKAQASLSILAPPVIEKVIIPEPIKESEVIINSTPETKIMETKLPEEIGTPTCASGSTYSYTFKKCLEDTPTQRSPYDGLPCPGEGVPNYAKIGCIPQ